MNDLYRVFKAIQASKQDSVLATVIQVEGSSYRKPGTSMMLRRDGTYVGLISAGCLEQDLACRVEEILAAGTSVRLCYDMRAEDDLGWGQGAGCNGKIHVLVQPVDATMRGHIETALMCMERGETLLWVIRMGGVGGRGEASKTGESNHCASEYLFQSETGQSFGLWAGAMPNRTESIKRLSQLSGPRAATLQVPRQATTRDTLYMQSIPPRRRIIIFGAGPDARPLSVLATSTGFHVIVVDWRPAYCEHPDFIAAEHIILTNAAEAIAKLHLSEHDAVVVMTHQYQRDRDILQHLVNQKVGYLGVLGSRNRTRRLFGENAGNASNTGNIISGCSNIGDVQVPPHVHTPLGLPIGADGPEEIAISALAEIVQAFRIGVADVGIRDNVYVARQGAHDI